MFALIAAVILFILALLTLIGSISGDMAYAVFLAALGSWALHFAYSIPIGRGRRRQ